MLSGSLFKKIVKQTQIHIFNLIIVSRNPNKITKKMIIRDLNFALVTRERLPSKHGFLRASIQNL